MSYAPFVTNILSILEKNGYPENRVTLPLERMYEVAHAKQLNFNKVLDQLRERGIDHEKTTEKIIFFPLASQNEAPSNSPDLSQIMNQAMEMMQMLSPEQRAELQKTVMGMSDSEKADLLQKAREMGLK